jgi:hypothetical protein
MHHVAVITAATELTIALADRGPIPLQILPDGISPRPSKGSRQPNRPYGNGSSSIAFAARRIGVSNPSVRRP